MLLIIEDLISGAIMLTLCAIVPAQSPPVRASPFDPGIEVFVSADVPERIRGKRLGLITNHAGIDRHRQV